MVDSNLVEYRAVGGLWQYVYHREYPQSFGIEVGWISPTLFRETIELVLDGVQTWMIPTEVTVFEQTLVRSLSKDADSSVDTNVDTAVDKHNMTQPSLLVKTLSVEEQAISGKNQLRIVVYMRGFAVVQPGEDAVGTRARVPDEITGLIGDRQSAIIYALGSTNETYLQSIESITTSATLSSTEYPPRLEETEVAMSVVGQEKSATFPPVPVERIHLRLTDTRITAMSIVGSFLGIVFLGFVVILIRKTRRSRGKPSTGTLEVGNDNRTNENGVVVDDDNDEEATSACEDLSEPEYTTSRAGRFEI